MAFMKEFGVFRGSRIFYTWDNTEKISEHGSLGRNPIFLDVFYELRLI